MDQRHFARATDTFDFESRLRGDFVTASTLVLDDLTYIYDGILLIFFSFFFFFAFIFFSVRSRATSLQRHVIASTEILLVSFPLASNHRLDSPVILDVAITFAAPAVLLSTVTPAHAILFVVFAFLSSVLPSSSLVKMQQVVLVQKIAMVAVRDSLRVDSFQIRFRLLDVGG